ncbi:hypothetical protein HAX54_042412 [Datura stramonium]|uniref:Uncharacterized protein n=1 Tax=Datura stramonium TaxID=4076 RepID=A0ABS8W353_DATST|nr:hypothetical protein [Datura stramonium]
MSKLTKHRTIDGPSLVPSSNQVIIPPKFQPTIGGARRRVERDDTTHYLRDENTDSEADGFGSSNDSPDSDEGSGNETTSSPAEDTEPIRRDIIKGKTPRFRDNLRWQVKTDEKYFQEGLTTTTRGHLKRSIAEEVRIIDSELPECPNIEAKYKFYGLGWMSEALGHYYPTMVHEFYANYIAFQNGLCKKRQKSSEIEI